MPSCLQEGSPRLLALPRLHRGLGPREHVDGAVPQAEQVRHGEVCAAGLVETDSGQRQSARIGDDHR